MKVNIQCPKCKKTALAVELFGPYAEYSTQCPVCGPVFGFVIVGTPPIQTADMVLV